MSLTVERIIEIVASETGVTFEEMKEKHRARRKVEARMIAAYCIKLFLPDVTLKAIGQYLGGRDHSTVIHYIDSIDGYVDTSGYWAHLIEQYTKRIALEVPAKVVNYTWETNSTL